MGSTIVHWLRAPLRSCRLAIRHMEIASLSSRILPAIAGLRRSASLQSRDEYLGLILPVGSVYPCGLRCKPHPGPREGLNPLAFELHVTRTFMQPVLRTFGANAWRFQCHSYQKTLISTI